MVRQRCSRLVSDLPSKTRRRNILSANRPRMVLRRILVRSMWTCDASGADTEVHIDDPVSRLLPNPIARRRSKDRWDRAALHQGAAAERLGPVTIAGTETRQPTMRAGLPTKDRALGVSERAPSA